MYTKYNGQFWLCLNTHKIKNNVQKNNTPIFPFVYYFLFPPPPPHKDKYKTKTHTHTKLTVQLVNYYLLSTYSCLLTLP